MRITCVIQIWDSQQVSYITWNDIFELLSERNFQTKAHFPSKHLFRFYGGIKKSLKKEHIKMLIITY